MGDRRCRVGAARLAAGSAAWLTVGLAAPAWAADGAFTMSAAEVTRPVGMTTEPEAGRHWVVNAGSGQLRVHAIDASGKLVGTTRSTDEVTSPQALAWHDRRLYVGDVGGTRRDIDVWTMFTPVPNTIINKAERIRLTYPDGAHRASAMFVTEQGRIAVVALATTAKAAIYVAPENASRTEPNALQKVADAPAGVTDATTLPDGRVVLRTTGRLLTLDPTTYRTVASAPIAGQPDGESLAVDVAGTRLLCGQANARAPVLALDIPGGLVQPTSAPPSTSSPTPVATPTVAAPFELTGTTMVVAGAAGAAALAALVVIVKR